MARKIILSFGTVRDSSSVDVDEGLIKRAVSESRWRKGTALINGRNVEVLRSKGLDEYNYKIGDQLLATGSVEAFLPSEFLDWRDG